MSGIDSIGNFDDEGGGSGAAEKNQEQFRDSQKAKRQQIAAIKKAEKGARQKDGRVADVLMRFLQSNANTQLMLLISRCLAHNIPAGLILGILALTEDEARTEFEALMGEAVLLLNTPDDHETRALVTMDAFDAANLPTHIKKAIDAWVRGLLQFGLTQPTRLLATAQSPTNTETGEGGIIFPDLAQLSAVVLQTQLASENITADIATTRPFAELLLKTVLEQIRERMGKTKELGSGEEDE